MTIPPPQRTALVVDDDEFVRNMACRQLGRLGFDRIVTAPDGVAASSILAGDGPFDVILLDLMMPGMDGVEVLRRLGEVRAAADVILTSGLERKMLDTAETLARAHGLHVLGSVPKPLTTSAIAALLETRSRATARAETVEPISNERLLAAIRSGLIRPWFQPKIVPKSGQLASVEALARWIDPESGAIPPARFIGVAEAGGSIDELTRVVCHDAFAAIAAWHGQGLRPALEINVSARTLGSVGFPDEMAKLAAHHGIAPDRVTFEITESSLVDHLSQSLDTLTRLRLKGFHLAMDDFGTGYSTFTQIKTLPLSELKIDQSFVRRACVDAEARAIVDSCIGLAHKFSLITVAEGVEDEQTAALLGGLKVDLLQGYHFAPAMPATELRDWWRSRGSTQG